MAHDKNTSPTGWYFGSYLLRFIELDAPNRDDPEAKFLSWENTVLVQAQSLEEAFEKIEKIGKDASTPYQGGEEGVWVQWDYLGVSDVLPIYEDIADGVEIAWTEHTPRKLKNLKQWVQPKADIRQ